MNSKISVAALVITGGLWSTSSFSAGFDCNKASGYVEQTICSTPDLSSMDDKVNALYSKAIKQNPATAPSIRKGQLGWLKEIRNKATSYMELQSAYVSRINDLYIMLNNSPAPAGDTQAATPTKPAQSPQAGQRATATTPATPVSQPQSLIPAATTSTDQFCLVQVTYSKDAKEQYISDKKTQPNRLRVTDSGDRFTIHFDQYYGLGDMDSELISARGKEYMNVKNETDGSTSFYRRSEANGFYNYILTSVKGSMKPRFEANLYACKTSAPQPDKAEPAAPAPVTSESVQQAIKQGDVKTYHLEATSKVLPAIGFDFRSDSTLDMSVYNDAQNYPEDSSKRYRIIDLYKQYGVTVSDFDRLVQPQCNTEINGLQKESEIRQSQWAAYSNDPEVKQQQENERQNFLNEWSARYEAATRRMEECWAVASRGVPNHSQR